ncbi:SDR family NAD(P)-dependent oxidoreductase [Kribbella antibiotica]|uniref:SDR family NAD(P)-dependent oxidoreductase n=1 Tax=Kribbella antibiotica TaxID=190195 RepID=A0A4R4ZL38_9ACTN|nr:SDR family NAD(P)-dependent oxidoreductase [Kribbella antibiotica]TDD58920.1 SDR family NAD(P)-dependent oxidoreductase [Kribbella antibiotica]
MTITLITGANKGLGYETARQLVALGHTVYAGARDPERGQAAADQLGATFIQLDVTDQASVEAAAKTIQEIEGHLDVLVNNAGVQGGMPSPAELTADRLQAVYDVNVFGLVRVTQAFLPLLEASTSPVIVNIGSSLGSSTIVTDPARMESSLTLLDYASSKAAVIMLTVQYAKALPHLRINVVEPGYTATDLNDNRGHQTVEEGTEIIVKMATVGPEGPTGTYQDRNGTLPW